MVTQLFYLTDGEKQLLLSSGVGEGLFFAGQSHVALSSIAAPYEHKIITSSPEEVLAAREAAKMASLAQPEAPVDVTTEPISDNK